MRVRIEYHDPDEKIMRVRIEYPIARKEYRCDACEWLFNSGMVLRDFNFSERKMIARAIRDKGRIMPGQRYIMERQRINGRSRTFRARLDIDSICYRHELYH